MLQVAVHALLHGAGHLAGCHLAGQEAVLGVVLVVAAGEGGAVGVHGGGVPAVEAVVQALLTHHLAHLIGQLLIPGGGQHLFGGEAQAHGVSAGSAHPGGPAHGAVVVQGSRLADREHLGGVVAGVGQHVGHLAHVQLVQQQVPAGVVIVLAPQVDEGQAVGDAGGGHLVGIHQAALHIAQSGVGVLVKHGLQVGLDGLLGLHVGGGGGGGEGVGEVGTGHVQGRPLHRGVGEHVGHLVELVDSGHHVGGALVVPVVDHLLQALGEYPAAVALGQLSPAVGVVAEVEGVVALVQHVAALALIVIGGQRLGGHGEGQGLGGAGLQLLGLAEGHQHHLGLLHAAIGVGGLGVDLHHLTAGAGAAGVGHLHVEGKGPVSVSGGVVVLHGEVDVGQAVAEGVLDGGVVVKAGVVARQSLGGGGLVVAVAHVDALLILDEGAGLIAADGAVHVGVVELLEVLERGVLGQVVYIGVHGPAGGGHLAGEYVGQGPGALVADAAHPQGGVNAVGLVLQEAQLHGVGGVAHHDDLAEHTRVLLLLDVGEHLLLDAAQLQVGLVLVLLTGGVVAHVGGQVAALAANPADEHDGRAVIGGEGVLQAVGVVLDGHLGDDVVDEHGRAHGRDEAAAGVLHRHVTHAGGHGHLIDRGGDGVVGVEVVEVRVDGEAVLLQGGLVVHRATLSSRAARTGVDGVHAGTAEQGHRPLAVRERQGAVVILQQHDALALNALGQLLTGGEQLFGAGIVGRVVVAINAGTALVLLDDGVTLAEVHVHDRVQRAGEDHVDHNGQHQQDDQQYRADGSAFLFLFHFRSSFMSAGATRARARFLSSPTLARFFPIFENRYERRK